MNHLLTALLLSLSLTAGASEQNKKEANSHFEKATKAFAEENLSESFIHVKNALKLDPDYLSAKLLLAKVFFNDGNLYAAEETFKDSLAQGSDINAVLPLYGATLILLSKPNELLALGANSAKFTKQTQFEWQILKGQALLQKGQTRQAKRALEKASQMRKGDTRALNTLAIYYLGENNLDEAQQFAERSIAINDKNERTWQLKGEIATKADDLESALEYFSHGYELDSEDPKILRSMARVHLELGNPQDAKVFLKKVLEQTPDDPSAALLYAAVILGEGEEEQGMQLLGDLSSKLSNTDSSENNDAQATLFIKATTEFIQGNNEKARTLLGNYLLDSPSDIAAIRMLANLHLKNSNKRQTILLLESHNKHISNDFGLLLLLANLYIDEGKLFTAEQEITKMQALLPGHPYIAMLEADILNAQRKPEDALTLLSQQKFDKAPPLAFILKRGRFEINTGRIEQAAETAEALLTQYPDNISALNFAAAINMKVGKLDAAKQQLNAALKLNPKNLTARYNHALSLKMDGHLTETISAAKAILNDTPEHIPSILLIANIRTAEKNYGEAMEWIDKVNAYNRTHAAANELKLEILIASGDLEKAVKTTQFLYKNAANSTRYLQQEAELQIQLENYEKAQKPLYLLFSLWEKNPEKLRQLANLQQRSDNLIAARKSLEKAAALDQDSLAIQLDLARLSLLENDKPTVRGAISALRRQFGNHTQIEMLAADLARDDNHLDVARQHYTKAFKLDKNNSRSLVLLYQLTLSGVGPSEFHQLLETERQKDEIPGWALKLLADSYLNQGNRELALLRYEQLISKPELSGNASILNNLANIYAKTDLDKALKTAKRGLETNPNYPSLLDTVGWIYLEKNMPSDALRYLREASALDSSNPEIRYHQGLALAQLNRNSEAVKEFQAALQLDSAFPSADDAKKQLTILNNI